MKLWRLGALSLLAACAMGIAGCGGNSTLIGVTLSAPGFATGQTATVIQTGTLQFSATVTGASSNVVYWQVCLPASVSTTEPTSCTQGIGASQCTIPTVTAPLTGYGTITSTGLYTAPPSVPTTNNFIVVATSCLAPHLAPGTLNATGFGTFGITIDSGIRVQLTPAAVTIGTSETYQFTATVTGNTTNTAVTWSVNSTAGGSAQLGYICPNPLAPQPCPAGEYVGPSSPPGSISITATSAADPSKSATASVTVSPAVDPTISSLFPSKAPQGSAQQDVYLIGSNLFNTNTVFIAPPGQSYVAVPSTFISGSLLRATIPYNLLSQAGNVSVVVARQNGSLNIPGPFTIDVSPVRPSVVSASPASILQSGGIGSVSLNLIGGYFSPNNTTVQFNGSSLGVGTSVTNSRLLTLSIPQSSLSVPGLYPIVVHNSGIAAGQPSSSALNLAVTPSQTLIPAAPIASVGVGANPSAIAVDYADGLAVIANTGANTVSILNLATNTVTGTIAVGKVPTSVAVDDIISPHVALVVNSGDQTVSTINLATFAVTSTVSVAIGPTAGSPAGTAPVPFSVGVNSLTHRAIVAYSSFNEATVLDLSGGVPVVLQQVASLSTAPYGTGPSPQIAIDPRLNWAIVTPGGGNISTTNIVDLGRNAVAGDSGRLPEVIADFSSPSSGVGVNSETHQVFLTAPNQGTFQTFSALNDAVDGIAFTSNGVILNQPGYIAAASDPFENVGIAVNQLSSNAAIADLINGVVLQNVTMAAPSLAVAVDPASNEAIVTNTNNTVSILSLGPAINPLQILESSPSATLGGSGASALTMKITGTGFVGGSEVLLDDTPVSIVSVSANGRQIVATVPASMLQVARRYAVQVQNPGGAVSNVTDLGVTQAVTVGSAPVSVAVDTDRDLAVVTNSGSNTVSLVALSASTPVGPTQTPAGAVGTVGSPISVGANPQGVAVMPRIGVALVANDSNDTLSLVDETQTTVPPSQSGQSYCSSTCAPLGVSIDQDTGVALVANSLANTVTFTSISQTGTAPPALTLGSASDVDQNPTAIAIDPVVFTINPALGYAGITTSSQASSVDFLTVPGGSTAGPRATDFQLPTDIVYDPLNQVFLVVDSLQNNIFTIDPVTFTKTALLNVGINPTSLDYDYQTSTLVTVNTTSHTLSVADYVCPPPVTGVSISCPGAKVSAVLTLGGSSQVPTSRDGVPPRAIAVDPNLNVAVVVDQSGNRILIIPLPH